MTRGYKDVKFHTINQLVNLSKTNVREKEMHLEEHGNLNCITGRIKTLEKHSS